MQTFALLINGAVRRVSVPPDTPLLWVLRDSLRMTGTRFGCGAGVCGACTLHLDGAPVRSCVLPVSAVGDAAVTTIEGLGPHPLQSAWIAEQVPQCGYCQSGQLMQAAGLLAKNPRPTDADIDAWMTNLCRCATYDRIRRGIHRAAAQMFEESRR
ncbi:MAG: (2Fe-2S)-binding protein [Myxococcota bacterium]